MSPETSTVSTSEAHGHQKGRQKSRIQNFSTEEVGSSQSNEPKLIKTQRTNPASPTTSASNSNSPGRCGSGAGKMITVRVQMLDDSVTLFQVQTKAPGRILFDQVCKQLNLLEVDYFGLEYQDSFNVTYWLDLDKQMNHQVGLPSSSSNAQTSNIPGNSNEPLLRFCVKFYTPDPAQIEEEYTRYLFSLQIKRDLSCGQLQCNENTAALMASYIVQAECGDYVSEDYPDHTYLSTFKFVPQQDSDLERRIMESHKKHNGQSPAEADLNLLETARRCELYGIKMHVSKDHEGVPLNLTVAHSGVLIFQNYTKINTFSWAKIRKISFKRKKFLIKLHPEGYGYFKDIVEFYFEDRNHCKNFWKKCVEHHSFFRCSSTVQREREKHRILSRGSSFRYSGKTQKQMQEYVRENFVKRQSFQRHVRNLHSSMGNVGQSLSAQPLLPIGDNGVAGQQISLSCGAMNSTHFGNDLPQFGTQYANNNNKVNLNRYQHQSANNTPRRSHPESSISFGYATLASPYTSQQNQQIYIDITSNQHYNPQGQLVNGASSKHRHSIHGTEGNEVFIMDSEAEATSLSSRTDNRSETTVVEKERRAGNVSRRSSNRSNNSRSQTSLHSGHSGDNIGNFIDIHNNFEEGGHASSEDNLSHESYDVIEKDDSEVVVIETMRTTTNNAKPGLQVTQVNKFEKEFYRQAESGIRGMEQNSGSSKLSSMGSLNTTSSIMTPPPSMPSAPNTANVLGMQPYIPGNSPSGVVPILKQPIKRRTSGSSCQSGPQNQSSSRQSLTEYYDVVRAPNQPNTFPKLQSELVSNYSIADNQNIVRPAAVQATLLYSQTLPRFSKQDVPYVQPQNNFPYGSRTLPSRKREKSPVLYTRGRLVGGADISSASSSSHASPKMTRPKSLDFVVVSAKTLPSKTAYSYHDDTLDQPSSSQQHMEYDDSSSVVSGINELNYASSSDVPQTPEMPTIQFPQPVPFRHSSRGIVEERIYDIPEGIEGVTKHIVAKPTVLLPSRSSKPPPLPPHNPTVRFAKKAISQNSSGSRRAPFKLPPPNKTLLPTMSSTESESAFSARSAPTPIGSNPEALMAASMEEEEELDIRLVERNVPIGLISPPDESESTAVVESENVPAPPEFSGAADVADPREIDAKEDTDVEGDELSISNKKEDINSVDEQASPLGQDNMEDMTTSKESTVKKVEITNPGSVTDKQRDSRLIEDDEVYTETVGDKTEDICGSVITLESPPTVFGEETESTDPNDLIKLADMYVRLRNGSTISSNGGESDNTVPYIDEEAGSALAHDQQEGTRHATLSDGQRSSADDIPPPPPPACDLLINFKPKLLAHSSESSEGSLDIASIPPPAALAEATASKTSVSHDAGSGVMVEKVIHSHSRPSSNTVTDPMSFPNPSFAQRTLSRISETSSPSDNAKPLGASEEHEDEDTISEPNYTSSEENENPGSLNSDLPENSAKGPCKPTGSTPSAMQIVKECGLELGGEIEFPSPPSSLIEGNQTEVTHVEADSMFLEITPPEFQKETLTEDADDVGKTPVDETLDQEDPVKEKIPYDLSISSENNATRNNDSDASLHDSMEILEEVATEDHFEQDVDSGAEDSANDDDDVFEDRDVFEMPPLPSVLSQALEEPQGGITSSTASVSEEESQRRTSDTNEERKPVIVERIVTEEVFM